MVTEYNRNLESRGSEDEMSWNILKYNSIWHTKSSI